MRILLVAPGEPDHIDDTIVREIPYMRSRALFAPHAIAAVAAITPAEHSLVLHDESLRGPVAAHLAGRDYDVIGISVTSNRYRRALEVARSVRAACPGATIVAGGIGCEHLLREPTDLVDVLVLGEAEESWPEFLADRAAGSWRRVYQRVTRPDMGRVPPPRWDLLGDDIPHYAITLVQTTRGCPFDCAFCDVVYTFGRRPRVKGIAQVIEEIRTVQRLGTRMVFIADDNFAGNRAYAKELLRALIPVNNAFDFPLQYMTQLDLTVARDDELLELMADANFIELMIGVESVNPASLAEMDKKQNLRVDAVEAIRKIQSYGMAVLSHMIIGSDADDLTTFDRTAEFLRSANIVQHFCHPLMAPPGTRTWYRFAREGRLVAPRDDTRDRLDVTTNIRPRGMSRAELFEGLADYWERTNTPEAFLERARGFIAGIERRPNVSGPRGRGIFKMLRLVFQPLFFFLFVAEAADRRAFFALVRAAGRRAGWMVSRAVFAYTCFLMDRKRAVHDARIAREQAAWERANPEALVPEEQSIPIAQAVRDHSGEIFGLAWRHTRGLVADPEVLRRVVLEAVIDFSDRFGPTLAEFDDLHREHLKASCDRVLAARCATLDGVSPLAAEEPPPAFAKDMLDIADRHLRARQTWA